MKKALELLRDVGAPGILSGLLDVSQHADRLRVIPVNPQILQDVGPYALLLAVVSGVVGGGNYRRVGRDFGLTPLVVLTVIALVTLSPFVASRYDFTFGLSPEAFAVLATLAYPLFAAVTGLMLGGAWSIVVKGLLA